MKKSILTIVLAMCILPFSLLKADEGMWFLMHIERLKHRDMQKMGLQLTSEEIYSVNNHSLKDAIVQFNGGCTASIISKEGLVLTNHHCGYDAIADLSTPDKNLLKDGFWAKDKSQELQTNISVRFFVRMDDVSKRILALVNPSMSEMEREKVINQEIAKIQKENDGDGKYTVSVRSFFQGNEYYYFVYQDFKDVRLVATPTESIGKFGGDTDNWEWPRHTGDFSIFRVYMAKDGNPTNYSTENIPLNPKHYLPISTKGVKEGDFAMILGYPGRTNRWMPSKGIEQNIKYAYPAWVEASKKAMDIMKKYQDSDPKVRLDYASNYAGVANYWKNRQGMIDALTKHKTVNSKFQQENDFQVWANKTENKEKYGGILNKINAYYNATNAKSVQDNHLRLLLRNSLFAGLPTNLNKQLTEYFKISDEAKKTEALTKINTIVEQSFEKAYLPLEKEMFVELISLYAARVKNYPLASLITANQTNLNTYLNNAVDTSIFSSKEKLQSFLKNPSAAILTNDELLKISSNLIEQATKKSEELAKLENDYLASFRLLVDGYRKANPNNKYYPDANSTLRLSYGKVRGLPADKRNDAKKNYYTTLKGMVKKHKQADAEFDLSQPLIDLYNKKDFGKYAQKDGTLYVNFLTDNDITGGNSGSPVINGKGELIGLAFDGNIEAMAGDVIFDKNLQRTINVDIRFILFLMEKYAGASNLLQELTYVN